MIKSFVLAALLVTLVSCRPDDQKTETIDPAAAKASRALSPQLALHLDSGNAAFRRKDYKVARTHYTSATRLDEKQPAGWFGLYMVELAEGNTAAAQTALEKAQKLVPGATLIHPARK